MEVPRKLVVEVCKAHNLMPKDGQGSASPFVQVDFFNRERRRTQTRPKDLNPVWDEAFEFSWFPPHDDPTGHDAYVELTVYHKTSGRPAKFLGTVYVPGCSFAKRGEEALTVSSLESKGLFSHIKGKLEFKVYYYDDDTPVA